MSKNHQPILAAQLERRQVAQMTRQRWDRLWAVVILAVMTGLLGIFIAIQISHHL